MGAFFSAVVLLGFTLSGTGNFGVAGRSAAATGGFGGGTTVGVWAGGGGEAAGFSVFGAGMGGKAETRGRGSARGIEGPEGGWIDGEASAKGWGGSARDTGASATVGGRTDAPTDGSTGGEETGGALSGGDTAALSDGGTEEAASVGGEEGTGGGVLTQEAYPRVSIHTPAIVQGLMRKILLEPWG